MLELNYGYEFEIEIPSKNVVIESIIDGMDKIIKDQFKEYGKCGGTYTNTLINTKINSILKQKLNKNTTTRIFNTLFKTERVGIKKNNRYYNGYRIIAIN